MTIGNFGLDIPCHAKRTSCFNIKNRRPNHGISGGGDTFLNKNGFLRRTTMIRCALDSPDLGQPFRYPEHDISMYRKNFRDTWSQKSPQNKAFWGLYKLFWPRIFLQKLATFRFWSIKSPKDASEWFWSNWKIVLCLKNVSDAYKAFQKCTENFFWAIFKKLFFSKILFYEAKNSPNTCKKKDFRKKKMFENCS